jgi:hypothetical protein
MVDIIEFDGKHSFTTVKGREVTPMDQKATAKQVGDKLLITGFEPSPVRPNITDTVTWEVEAQGLEDFKSRLQKEDELAHKDFE